MSRTGLVALIVANLFVALQTLRHEWGYYETILIYWVEVVILGFYNALRHSLEHRSFTTDRGPAMLDGAT